MVENWLMKERHYLKIALKMILFRIDCLMGEIKLSLTSFLNTFSNQ